MHSASALLFKQIRSGLLGWAHKAFHPPHQSQSPSISSFLTPPCSRYHQANWTSPKGHVNPYLCLCICSSICLVAFPPPPPPATPRLLPDWVIPAQTFHLTTDLPWKLLWCSSNSTWHIPIRMFLTRMHLFTYIPISAPPRERDSEPLWESDHFLCTLVDSNSWQSAHVASKGSMHSSVSLIAMWGRSAFCTCGCHPLYEDYGNLFSRKKKVTHK